MEMVLFLQCDALQFFWCDREDEKKGGGGGGEGGKKGSGAELTQKPVMHFPSHTARANSGGVVYRRLRKKGARLDGVEIFVRGIGCPRGCGVGSVGLRAAARGARGKKVETKNKRVLVCGRSL